MANARIQLPKEAKRGEVIEVRIVIRHPMETGYRHDDIGRQITRNVIHRVACSYNGFEIFRAIISSGISANPYFQFYTRAVDSGELVFTWIDDAEVEGTASAPIVVNG